STLTFTADTANAGPYKVIVTNPSGSTTSAEAQLTVITTPQITSQPQSALSSPGATLTFNVGARGRQPLTYQWYFNNAPAPGNAAASAYTINSVQPNNAGSYYVVVTNTSGSITSAVAQLTVFTGTITQDLVVHLAFDDTLSDTSGRGNNATYDSHN